MKKTKIIAGFALMLSLTTACALAGCGEHEHTYSSEWTKTATHHYYEATCEHKDELKAEEMKGYGAHVYDDETDTTCNTCGYERSVTPAVETGTVTGTVKAYGKALSGVKVAVGTNETVTSVTGAFTLEGVEIAESVTVAFTKSGYADKSVTIAKADWNEKAVSLGEVVMNLTVEEGMLTGVVKVGDNVLAGATVTVGDKTAVTTDAEGKYSVEHIATTTAGELDITIEHPGCDTYTGKITVTAGAQSLTHDATLTARTAIFNKTYFEFAALDTADATDFKHVQGTEMWHVEHGPAGHRVINDHGEGLCLHVDNNVTDEDMQTAIYQKLSITAANSKMMFRARGFLGATDKAGLLSVRVVDLTDYTVEEVKQNAEDDSAWYAMDSNGYIQYLYDLSAYKGKDVVVIIGAKQGNHNAIERIRFIGENEDWLMPFVTAEDLANLTAENAQNMEGVDAIKNALGGSSWNKVGDQSGANEGWLLKDADYAEEDSTLLRVFAYKKLTFSGTGTIVVRARTFSGQNSVSSGHDGQIYPQIILRLIDGQGNFVSVNGNAATVDNGEGCKDFYFTVSEPLNGDYTFVIGMARGQRLALESVKFAAPMVAGNVTGTAKLSGAAVENATVSYEYGYNVKGSVTTDTQGQFTLPVRMLADGELTVKIETEGATADFNVSASDITDGTYAKGDVSLIKLIMEGLTTADIEALEVRTDMTFGHSNDGNGAIQRNWDKYGDVDFGHGEGACIQRNSKTPVSYLYAKFTISEANRYMKFNARMFVRPDDQAGYLQVKIIKADGTVEILNPIKAYRSGANVSATNIIENGKVLKNDNDGYTEGIYDLSAYVGQTVVIVIQDVNVEVTKNVHNAINEIAFRSNPFYADGSVSGTVTDSEGAAVEGVSVTLNGVSVLTNAEGQYSINVAMGYDSNATLTFLKVGYGSGSVEISGAAVVEANGELTGKDVTLTASKTLEQIIAEKADSLTAVTATQFSPANNGGADGWTKSSDYNENYDICIPLGEFIYAKMTISESNRYMKLNCRDDHYKQGSKVLVSVYADGQLTAVAPWRVYGTTDAVIEGNYLINNRNEGYNEGIYDFSAYVGQEVIIVIQTADCLESKTNAYTQCNEIAFGSVKVFDKGDSTNYYAIPASTGDPE